MNAFLCVKTSLIRTRYAGYKIVNDASSTRRRYGSVAGSRQESAYPSLFTAQEPYFTWFGSGFTTRISPLFAVHCTRTLLR